MAAINFPQLEENLLAEWEQKKIFEKSLEKTKNGERFVFFEGPPTANGRPGIHHVEARAFKDLIPRFQTMRGRFVERKAGWDTHGLPVELAVEKQLGLKNKKDVEKYGLAAFNVECRKSVWTYLDEWQRLTQRMGYWVDLEHPYVTYHNEYVESLWWVLAQIHGKGLVYKGHRVTPHCPRCDTSLSSHELAQGYKDAQDPSVFIKFAIAGKPKTYFLVWTTTPWTLPSNVALAMGKDVTYAKVKMADGDTFILAKERLSVLDGPYEVLEEMKGSTLATVAYEPLFQTLAPQEKNAENAHKVYLADFVSTTDGTGIVHIAPAYGEDDYRLGEEAHLPTLFTVDHTGMVTADIPGRGEFFKKADDDIKADLTARGLLYKSETITHTYPFCWRCDTPILYFAKDSWYIEMSKLRDKLVANGEKINWEPAHIKDGRFGEWLRGIKDWAISRERYWGTPLPLWKCEKGHVQAASSLDYLEQNRFRQGNRLFVVRHGEYEGLVKKFLYSWPEPNGGLGLTSTGVEQVRATAAKLKTEGIDLIVSSDLRRTRETAEMLKEATGAEIVYDERLREIGLGEFNGMTHDDYHNFYTNNQERFTQGPAGGENYNDVRRRVMACALEYDRKYEGKKIAFVTHGDPIWFLAAATRGVWGEKIFDLSEAHYLTPGEYLEIKVPNWPFDENGAVDVHRPFIDEIVLKCPECGGEARRVPEVMDVWFDSGAMPFAQWHYPKGAGSSEKVDGGQAYPADFISEAIDQTRGWFYTLLAVATLLDREAPYKNVICLGHILDAKGQKMSKSKGNVVDPWKMFTKYGADAVRFHLYTVSAAGDAKRFDEKDVDGVVKKVFLILWNCLSFWKMYAAGKPAVAELPKAEHVLDRWILSELASLTTTVMECLEKYDIPTAGRAIADFINDLSTWYVRRSRDRFKDGDTAAVATLGHVLLMLAKLMAPFTPFVAEGLYKELGGQLDSVHLEDWPKAGAADENLALQMKRVRDAASRGLEKRASSGINVRQALANLTLKTDAAFEGWMKEVVAEEVNVKAVAVEKASGFEVELDTNITPELKREGAARELTRHLNALRKEAGLTINDRVIIRHEVAGAFWPEVLREHGTKILADARATALEAGLSGELLKTAELDFDGEKLKFGIAKA